jgi:predicted protein tyrosine phosphatase
MTKILFVCSANVDRSPTAEHIYKNHPGLEVKSAGVGMFANQQVTEDLIQWADIVLCMEDWHEQIIRNDYKILISEKIIDYLNIDDDYRRMDPELINIIKEKTDIWLSENLNAV